MDHVLVIMETRIQGNKATKLEICPTNPDDADFFARGYAAHWIGTKDEKDIATAKSCYKRAITLIK